MIGESVAIAAIMLVMSFMFLRAQKRIFALLVLPLAMVPVCYLVGRALSHVVSGGRLDPLAVGMLSVGAGLALAIGGGFLLSRSIPTRRGKTMYLAFCILFPAALTAAYYVNLT